MGTKRTSLGPKSARRRFAAAFRNSDPISDSDAEESPAPAPDKGPILDEPSTKSVDSPDSRVPFVPERNGSTSAVRDFPVGCGIDGRQGKEDNSEKPPVAVVGNAVGSSNRGGSVDAENSNRKDLGSVRSVSEKKGVCFEEERDKLKQKQVEGGSVGFDRERVTMAMYRERIASMASMLQGPGQRGAASVPAQKQTQGVETSRGPETRLIILGLMSAQSCPWVNKSKVVRNKPK